MDALTLPSPGGRGDRRTAHRVCLIHCGRHRDCACHSPIFADPRPASRPPPTMQAWCPSGARPGCPAKIGTVPIYGRSPGGAKCNSLGREPSLLHTSDPIRPGTLWVRMVKKAGMATAQSAVATQPDSPSRQAGWGLVFIAFVASCPASFTIHARWMGSLRDLCVTTRASAPGPEMKIAHQPRRGEMQ